MTLPQLAFAAVAASMLMLAAPTAGAPEPAPTAATGERPAASSAAPSAPTPELDGRGFDGRIRAQGWIGLVSVEGRLSFEAGQLVWTARGQRDTGPYTVQAVPGGWSFEAEHGIARGERVRWRGHFDGRTIRDVQAQWQRVSGDWVHDLLLPEVVTLEFRPAAPDARRP